MTLSGWFLNTGTPDCGVSAGGFYAVLFGCWNINPTWIVQQQQASRRAKRIMWCREVLSSTFFLLFLRVAFIQLLREVQPRRHRQVQGRFEARLQEVRPKRICGGHPPITSIAHGRIHCEQIFLDQKWKKEQRILNRQLTDKDVQIAVNTWKVPAPMVTRELPNKATMRILHF